MDHPSRREFLKSTVTTACSAGLGVCALAELLVAQPAPSSPLAALPPAPLPIKKGLVFDMLPAKLSYAERMKLARDVGFEVVQAPTTPDEHLAEEIKKAADAANIRIDSVMNMDHWKYPLSSANQSDVDRSMAGMETSLRNAKLWGADTVLLVPGVVNPETTYEQCYERSQANIRKLIPLAKEMGVIIAIEEVWNKFLVSPVDFARYVDSFASPQIRAYFDVGNIVFYGYPQHWIRTLGKRIVKLHIKDFYFRKGETKWVSLGEGDIKWREVYSALSDIGYNGSATVELSGGDAGYLKEVSARFGRILSGEPVV